MALTHRAAYLEQREQNTNTVLLLVKATFDQELGCFHQSVRAGPQNLMHLWQKQFLF